MQPQGIFCSMKTMIRPIRLLLIFAGLVLFLVLLMQPLEILKFQDYIDVLFPKGIIALKERNLLFIIQAIMLLVIIPVYALTFIFSWRYRAGNRKAKYDPHLVDNVIAEYIWWGIPLILTIIISLLTWHKTHELDPYKPLESDKKALTIQVVALQWKWLFIYPEEQIASLNFFQFPLETPIHFEITSDAPMNSFWIPKLGGQMYAMPSCRTQLNLMASEVGDFRGSSANISGEGFSGMHFIARASSEEDYRAWIKSASQSTAGLNWEEYRKLAAPSKDNPPVIYQLEGQNLFDQIINKYMHPPQEITKTWK